MKTLYTFKVGRPTFTESSVKNEDGSETISRIKGYEPVEIFIKKPSHREIDEMDLFYSIQISELQAQGLATNMMILNSYENSGGLDSKKEVASMKQLLEDIKIKRNQFLKEQSEGISNDTLIEELKDMSVKLEEYQENLKSVFDRSAESVAERRLHQWATFFLTYIKDGEYRHVFRGQNYNQKLDGFYEILDEPETFEFENKVFTKANILIGSWLRKRIVTEEDFKTLESYIDEELEGYV